jgi:hypothetical protein
MGMAHTRSCLRHLPTTPPRPFSSPPQEAVRGTRKSVQIGLRQNANKQTIDIDVPAGVDVGDMVEAAIDLGGAGRGTGRMTAMFPIEVLPHPVFQREGADVFAHADLPFVSAVLGTTMRVETIDGQVELIVPPLSKEGDRLRIRSKGVFSPRRGIRGDHYVLLRWAGAAPAVRCHWYNSGRRCMCTIVSRGEGGRGAPGLLRARQPCPGGPRWPARLPPPPCAHLPAMPRPWCPCLPACLLPVLPVRSSRAQECRVQMPRALNPRQQALLKEFQQEEDRKQQPGGKAATAGGQ